MGNIPCSLDCKYQSDGCCCLDTAGVVSCDDGKCPHYLEKNDNTGDGGNA